MNMNEANMNDENGDPGDPPRDELDVLLRTWHHLHAQRAGEACDRIVRSMADGRTVFQAVESDGDGSAAFQSVESTGGMVAAATETPVPHHNPTGETPVPHRRNLIRRLIVNRYSPIAAALLLAAMLIPTLLPTSSQSTYARDVVMVPDGGRLDALDAQGRVRGPCPLKHADVDVAVTGHFMRVTLTQKFHNPYPDKIEAVYTFPLSHRAAVDRMNMTIGDRVIVGEVKERAQARAIYEAARAAGHIASLLEQERPNIFTQSVANIEPGAEIDVTLSYVELLESKDGTYSFEFPMVVGPRYIPGAMRTASGDLPAGLRPGEAGHAAERMGLRPGEAGYQRRTGVVLLGPASFTLGQQGDVSQLGALQTGKLAALLHDAVAIEMPAARPQRVAHPGEVGVGDAKIEGQKAPAATTTQPADAAPAAPALWYRFEATYCDGSKDLGEIYTNGIGWINGRWFYTDPTKIKNMGAGFSPDTTQVPDASRITPEPVRPGKRAGHDISLSVAIDTGGPAIRELASALHQIEQQRPSPSQARLQLRNEGEIPNRDFVLSWKHASDKIEEATFTHTGRHGNFFSLILQPPERVTDAAAVARELVFVLDTSGSMSGFPIEKAKAVMGKAIAALRPQDTFNLITFSGDTHILWDQPKPGTPDNITAAQQFLSSRAGGGGTEMMKAIEAALVQNPALSSALTPDELANLPADGREVTVRTQESRMTPVFQDGAAPSVVDLVLSDGQKVRARIARWMLASGGFEPTRTRSVQLTGRWITEDRQRLLAVREAVSEKPGAASPIRICCFMTDGYVGNDMQIIDAIKKNAKTTRVFSFGIGNSVNRYLLDGMARAGRGESEYVLLESDGDAAVQRFTQRIQTPVLTDIELQFSDNLKVVDLVPARIDDLFDVKPLVLHGRYTTGGSGTLTIRGNTGSGKYERALKLDLPVRQPEHDTIATLWARGKVEDVMNRDLAAAQQNSFPPELRSQIVTLGEQFQIMTQFTSFVAVEKARVTIAGQPRLVPVPIEMPEGVSYEGVFGGEGEDPDTIGELSQSDWHLFGISDADGDGAADATISLNQVGDAVSGARIHGFDPLGKSEGKTTTMTLDTVDWAVKVPDSALLFGMGADNKAVQAHGRSSSGRPVTGVSYGYQSLQAGAFNQSGFTPAQQRISKRLGEISNSRGYFGRDSGGGGGGGGFGGGGGGRTVQFTLEVGGDNHQNAWQSAVSDAEVYAYPPEDQWRIVPPSEGDREVRQRLSVNLPSVNFPADTRLDKAIEWLREQSQAKFDVNWNTLSLVGVAPTTTVSLDLQKVKLETALEVLLEHVGAAHGVQLGWDVADGAVRVSTAEELSYRTRIARGRQAIPFFCQRVALGIANLAKDGKLDEARKLADELANGVPDFQIGVHMRAALSDAALSASDRDKRIAALADEARKPIDAAIREAKLRRRLDERLYRLARTPATQPAPAELTLTGGSVRVTVLVADVKAETLAALTKAGFIQEAVAASSRLVVGQAPRSRLTDIAMVDAVRKVDPTMLEP